MANTTRIAILGDTETAAQVADALTTAGAQAVADVAEADIVLSVTTPLLALKTAREAVDGLATGAVYVDASGGTPATARALAEVFSQGLFADAAFAGGEPLALALAVSGSGAARAAELLEPFVTAEVISDVPGQASARVVLRSILDNAMAAVLVDTLWAAESVSQAKWMHEEILREFDSNTAATAQALLADTSVNFKRRQMDMQDVVELLSESGYESTMLAPIQFTHGRIMHSKKIPFAKG
jgi:putative dehydrogenase